jgi:membrane protein CcdC involved in cytochrome C biogenesis
MPHTLVVVTSLLGAAAVLAWRMRETQRAISVRKIVIPPLAMSTGFSMFLFPPSRVPLEWAALALIAGAVVFAYPVMRTSRLEAHEGRVYLRRSPAFLWILLALVAVRFALRSYLEQYIDPLQTGALFYLLAFGMIVRWRVGMLRDFRRLQAQLAPEAALAAASRE